MIDSSNNGSAKAGMPQHLRVTQPAKVSRKGEKLLIVWDDPAQWLIGDNELLELIQLLDGSRSPADAVDILAQKSGRQAEALAGEAEAALSMLDERGLLGGAKVQVEPDKPRLANITYNLTNRCNLKCSWCYNADRNTPEASVEDVMAALREAKHVFSEDVTFNILGGEPTLNKARLLKCIELANKIFERPVLMSTNATMIDSEFVRALSNCNVEVQVSIDAPDSAGHDAIRGNGVFAKALDGTKLLVQAGVTVIMSMVFDSESHSQFAGYLELAQSLGVAEVRFIPMRLIGRAAQMRERMPNLLAAYNELQNITVKRPDLTTLLKRDYFSILNHVCSIPGRRTGCGLGSKVLFIDADGSYYPCPNFTTQEFCCGHVDSAPIAELLHLSPVLNHLRETCHVDQRVDCRSCTYRHWCAGDCRAEAMHSGEDLLSGAPHCAEIPKLIETMQWGSPSQ